MKIINKKAGFEYSLQDRVEAGIVLIGAEVKSIKSGRADLSVSFARIKDGEAFLVNANFPGVPGCIPPGYNPTRTRKLLLKRDELISLETKAKQQKLTFVPISLYTKGSFIKVGLALGKAKRQFEKRETKRRKDIQRDIERELRGKE